MPTLKVLGFDGVVPRTSPTMLEDTQAQEANNVKLYSGELRYWQGGDLEQISPTTNPATIYKLYGSGTDFEWLTWDVPVNVTPGPLDDVSDYRVYYTGDGPPKKTNYALATSGAGPYPTDWLHMGVPAPSAPPTVNVTGSGSGASQSRAYIYTYVSTFGALSEESAPSPPSSIVTVQATGNTVTINSFAAAPSTNYNITSIRIYRTVTGTTTDSYLFVAEIPIATTSYVDAVTAANLGEALPTLGWTAPPVDLQGLTTLPGGTLVGFENNTVYFSEPFFAHAWPIAYALSIPYKIIGLGVFGATVVVATERYPYLIHGGIPGAMSMERVPIIEPCVSARSIVSTTGGVVYASPNGLVMIGPSERGLMSGHLWRHDEWQALTPALMVGAAWDDKYVGIFPTLGQSAIILSSGDRPALSTLAIYATATYVDDKQAELYYADIADSGIYKLDALEGLPLTFEWKSKRFVLPQATTFSAMKLDAEYDQIEDFNAYLRELERTIIANNAAFLNPMDARVNDLVLNFTQMNGSPYMENLPQRESLRAVQVLLYGDDELKATFNMTSWDPVRIPPFKCRALEFKIIGTIYTRSLTLATTVQELHT